MRTTKKGKFFLYLILTLGALLILFPMYITITTTFKTPRGERRKLLHAAQIAVSGQLRHRFAG